jgi:hypothetical protein
MTAGTRIIRTTDASISTATAMPIASILTADWSLRTKLKNTTTMMAAAVVITRAVLPMPIATLRCASPVFAQASCTRESRNTS